MHVRTLAADIYRQAGIDERSREGIGYLALALLGLDGADYAPEDQDKPFVLERDPWRLLVREDLPRAERTFAIACGIAQWWLATKSLETVTAESLAIELVAPESALLEALEILGPDERALADDFVCPAWVIRSQLADPWRFGRASQRTA